MVDFGFGFWILFFVVFFGCGKMCGWGAAKYRKRQRDLESGDDADSDRLSRLESRVRRREGQRLQRPQPSATSESGERARQPSRLREVRKTPLQQLQEKFVEGRLTLSEYERELDRLERIE